MSEGLRLLLVEDNAVDRMAFERFVEREGLPYDYQVAASVSEAREVLTTERFDVVLMDYMLGDGTAFDLLDAVGETPSLIITGTGNETIAVEAMKRGVYDYLAKDPAGNYLTTLPIVVEQTLDRWRAKRELAHYQAHLEEMVAERTAELAATNEELRAEIGHRQQAEEELRESEFRLRQMTDTIGDVFWITEWESKKTIFASKSYEKIWGRTLQSLYDDPKGWADAIHLEDRDRAWENFVRLGEGETYDEEYRIMRPEGEVRWIRDRGYPVRGKQGRVIRVVGVAQDITERKRAEEEIRELNQFRESVIDDANVWLNVLDTEANVVIWNKAAEEISGYSREEVLGHDRVWEWLYPEAAYRSQVRRHVDAVISRGRAAEDFETTIRCKDGQTKIISWNSQRLLSEKGTPMGSIALGRDITVRKQAEERIERQVRYLSALWDIDRTITASTDLHVTLGVFLHHVTTQLGVDAADILLFSPHMLTLEHTASSGFRSNIITRSRMRLGEGPAGQAGQERRTIHIPDLTATDDEFPRRELLAVEDFITYFAVPLVAKGEVKAVLEVFHRSRLDPDPQWLDFLQTLASQGAVAIDNAKLFENLQRANQELTTAYDSTLEGWACALELRDYETEGHSRRVTEMTLRLAREMGVADREFVHVRRGALLHDIGKMGIPDSILLKPGSPTDDEWDIIRQHPVHAYEMLRPIPYLRPALDIPYCHHEKWDGSGYPQGLAGEAIPQAARIFAVADVYDALTSDRPYRDAWPEEEALAHIREEAGEHFDPEVVDVFLEVLESEWWTVISERWTVDSST